MMDTPVFHDHQAPRAPFNDFWQNFTEDTAVHSACDYVITFNSKTMTDDHETAQNLSVKFFVQENVISVLAIECLELHCATSKVGFVNPDDTHPLALCPLNLLLAVFEIGKVPWCHPDVLRPLNNKLFIANSFYPHLLEQCACCNERVLVVLFDSLDPFGETQVPVAV